MRFGLLGTVTVSVDGDGDGDRDDGKEPARPIGSEKVRALLAALLSTPCRAVPLDSLKSALWGDTPPTTATASLHNHVARLRRVLREEGRDGSRLRAAPSGYVLDVADGEFDVWTFLGHHAAARVAHRAEDWTTVLTECGAALPLWRGDPLTDVPLRSDRLRALAAHLVEARLLTLEWYFDAELALGRHQGLAAELAGLAAANPLRETFHRQLMLVLHRTHRQAEALAVYHVLRRTLVDELGVEPDSAVQAAYREILAEPALIRCAPAAPPAPLGASRAGDSGEEIRSGLAQAARAAGVALPPRRTGRAGGEAFGRTGPPGRGGPAAQGSAAARGARGNGTDGGEVTDGSDGAARADGPGDAARTSTTPDRAGAPERFAPRHGPATAGPATSTSAGSGPRPRPDPETPPGPETATDPAATPAPASPSAPARAGAPHTRRPCPSQLPADTPDFTGRSAELATLLAALRGDGDPAERGPRVAVVSGMGGIGKTALAVRAAHLLRAEFPDGQLYADLRGFGAGSARCPSDLLARFLGDLCPDGQPLPEDPDDRAVLWRDALHGRRLLLMLDNAGDAAQVVPLLPGGGDVALVVTSRRTLAELPGATRLALDPLTVGEQRELLVALCGSRRVAAEPEAAEGVLAACGGLPLALRIAGARMAARPNWPLTALAERLDGPDGSRLHALSTGGLAVQDTFAMSYVAMRDSPIAAERAVARAFRMLGVWPGHGVDPSAAAALLGRESGPAADDVLEALVDAHLLQTPRPGRYGFHDLVGEYAAVCAFAELAPEERRSAVRRITVWYAASVAASLAVLAPEGHPLPPLEEQPVVPAAGFGSDEEALGWCVRELPAIRESIRTAIAHGWPDVAWRTAAGLFGYAQAYWWTGEWTACLEEAMACVTAGGDVLGQAWMHSRLGVAHCMAERYDVGLGHLHVARARFEAAGDQRGVAAVLTNLTGLHSGTGDYDLALDYGRRSLELHRSLGDFDRVATVLGNLGDTHLQAGDPKAAEDCFREALAAWRARGSVVSMARALGSLGEAQLALGRPAEAVEALTETLALLDRLGDRATAADVLEILGRAHLARGDRGAARACWEEAVDLARAHRLTAKEEAALRGLAGLGPDGPHDARADIGSGTSTDRGAGPGTEARTGTGGKQG
ncbi:DNA-binding transcriptional activator of the SARP family [Actinacidiphila yanglinensis]|uniref:DNA-binding transcriptional activator of the SARP family n=1 Tax=Actinacidiphila yanglinensis TaxID=310779 RepID=A0A1H5YZF0_9ACTN|nr:BTAD domain-containing putative transcriptional regulator [Actinacidiphila yanglinensis]SEG29170.1 DNA-binding transcriptional activator of the SARP family [Actinacidiphila yanglinensis]